MVVGGSSLIVFGRVMVVFAYAMRLAHGFVISAKAQKRQENQESL